MTSDAPMTSHDPAAPDPSETTPADASPPSSAAPRRWRDAAILLPLLGTALWMPPLVGLILPVGSIAGVPAIALYVFGVWALLILGTARVTAGLCRDHRCAAAAAADGPGDGDGDGGPLRRPGP